MVAPSVVSQTLCGLRSVMSSICPMLMLSFSNHITRGEVQCARESVPAVPTRATTGPHLEMDTIPLRLVVGFVN